jgi:branched-chain amino acid transport system substrate-binding protein
MLLCSILCPITDNRLGVFRVKLSQNGRSQILALALLLATASPSLLVSLKAQFVLKEHPVTETEIRIGMVNGMSGPNQADESGIMEGCLAYFKHVNDAGGIYGRKLTLIAYDDRYEPLETVALTEHLINADKVFALLGYRGSATCDAVVSMVRDADITFLGAFTGTKSLHEPSLSMVYNLRPSLAYEVTGVCDFLIRNLRLKRIAFFGQADSLGDNGESGLADALHSYDLNITAAARYVRNSVDLEPALDEIVPAHPEVVVIAATSQVAFDFLAQSKKRGLQNTVFCMLSCVAVERFMKVAGDGAEGVFWSKLVPSPRDTSLACVRDYQRDMRALGSPIFSHLSFEAYLDAAVLVAGLERAGKNLSETALKNALDHLDIDLGGFPLRFTGTDHTGSRVIFLNCIHHGQLEPVRTLSPTAIPQ